jgi:hypothetical protein
MWEYCAFYGTRRPRLVAHVPIHKYLSIYIPIHIHTYPYTYLSIYIPIHIHTYPYTIIFAHEKEGKVRTNALKIKNAEKVPPALRRSFLAPKQILPGIITPGKSHSCN